ncbi:hypothetical protein SDC9_108149 [bioreactor metagenome]|uniref:Prepilin-type N-terminal cleavage/methylation domain-containing protein n=1 Tax=bioreactor metagenome TaxID=1076179 RepID=A0A645B9G9_9ZZZZ
MFQLKNNQKGMTLIELMLAVALTVIIFAGIATLFTHTVQHGWKGNSDRLSHVQNQIDINTVEQVLEKYISVATALSFINEGQIDLTINDPDDSSTTAVPINYSLVVVNHPTNSSMKTINLIRNTAPVSSMQLSSAQFSQISFSLIDTKSVRLTIKKSITSQAQDIILTCGGYK